MGINKTWLSTLAFRKFRNKTFELSRVYWTQQLGVDSIADQLNGKNLDEVAAKIIPASFDAKMHSLSVSETSEWLPKYMERNRLHLLVIYTGFLESYLKEIAFYYTASNGYILNAEDDKEPIELNMIGQAIASPIIKRSTLPEMIKYCAKYFEVDFGDNAQKWNKIYKIRCIAAHNGGTATKRFLQDMSGHSLELNPKERESIGLTWNELRKAMKYGDEIASIIDSKISNRSVQFFEVEEILRYLKLKKKLPHYKKIWEFLYENYSVQNIKKNDKQILLKKFYGLYAIV